MKHRRASNDFRSSYFSTHAIRGPRSALLALALACLLTACGGGSGSSSSGGTPPPTAPTAAATFYPVATSTQAVATPYPYDGLYAGFTAPTLNLPNSGSAAYIDAVNQLDGFSTVGNLYFDIPAVIDYTDIGSQIVIVNASTGAKLAYGTDFTVLADNATSTNPTTGAQAPISSFSSRVFIEPLKPFAPATTYWVGVLNNINISGGGVVIPGPEFAATASATPIAQQGSSFTSALGTDEQAALETVRSSLIYPTVVGLNAAGVATSTLVLAWPFTTQTIGKTLTATYAKAVASPINIVNTNLTTTTVVNIPGADIYAGTLALPYYLQNSGGDPQSTAPLTTVWQADATQPDSSASFQGIPCTSFASGAVVNGQTLKPSASTTGCFPVPLPRSSEVVPVLVAVPNADSNRSKPLTGWPVVVFQHPLSGDRTNMLLVATAFTAQGYAVIAMDLPLHGVTDTTNQFYRNQLFANTPAANLMTGERTFDLDEENNSTGVKGTPDGEIDPSGTWFINLASLLTTRDNLREAETDLMTLTKSLGSVDLDHDGTPDFDTTQVRFASMSLGSIVGISYLAYAPEIGAASVAVPGGGIAKLLDASYSIGPYISSYTASIGIDQGTDTYETFLRAAQASFDDGDPLNYAAVARAAHPMHMIEVVNDLVVPNAAPASPGSSTEDQVVAASYLAGGNPLYATLGLDLVGPIDVPVANPSLITGGNLGKVVQFNQGAHASLLNPAPGGDVSETNTDVTVEMQREMANFLATNGACLPIGEDCPAP